MAIAAAKKAKPGKINLTWELLYRKMLLQKINPLV
jgi:hypothetical protein